VVDNMDHQKEFCHLNILSIFIVFVRYSAISLFYFGQI